MHTGLSVSTAPYVCSMALTKTVTTQCAACNASAGRPTPRVQTLGLTAVRSSRVHCFAEAAVSESFAVRCHGQSDARTMSRSSAIGAAGAFSPDQPGRCVIRMPAGLVRGELFALVTKCSGVAGFSTIRAPVVTAETFVATSWWGDFVCCCLPGHEVHLPN